MTKDEHIECQSCGNVLVRKGKVVDEKDYWISHNINYICCEDCMNYPLDVIKEVYDFLKANQKKKAIEKIEEFDEESEESFLNPEKEE